MQRIRSLPICVALLIGLLGCGGRSEHRVPPSPAPPLRPTIVSAPIPAPLPIGGDVAEPVELSRVQPVWPQETTPHHFSNPIFIFEAVIDERGLVQNLRVVSEPKCIPPWPELTQAARKAILQWRYKPATFKGTPVPVYLTVSVLLHLP